MGAYLRDEDVPINILRIQRNLISTHTVLELWVIFSYCNGAMPPRGTSTRIGFRIAERDALSKGTGITEGYCRPAGKNPSMTGVSDFPRGTPYDDMRPRSTKGMRRMLTGTKFYYFAD